MSQTANDAPDLPAPSLSEPSSVRPTPPIADAPAPPSLSLDGELPRLGSTTMTSAPTEAAGPDDLRLATQAPIAPTAPPESVATPVGLDLPNLPSLPAAAPVLTEPRGIPAPDAGPTTDAGPDAGEHPMAHAMAPKSAPSEASRKAAELRAAKKAKARKVKIGVAVGAIVFAAVVGPPLLRWFGDAINEAGSTSTEQPAD